MKEEFLKYKPLSYPTRPKDIHLENLERTDNRL